MYLQRLACIYQSAECSRALCMIVNFFKKGKKNISTTQHRVFSISLCHGKGLLVRRKRNTSMPCTRRSVNKGPQAMPPLCTSRAAARGHPGQCGSQSLARPSFSACRPEAAQLDQRTSSKRFWPAPHYVYCACSPQLCQQFQGLSLRVE